MFKLACGVKYKGTSYHGWKKQKEVISIQECIEYAISIIASEPIKIFCAGLTDSGVHATGQVIHFNTKTNRSNSAWIVGINFYLPNDISIEWIIDIRKDFHARFSAISRTYRYMIFNHLVRPVFLENQIIHIKKFLNEKKMERASQFLLGENDFNSFKSAKCQSKSSTRNIHYVKIFRKKNYLIIDIKADSFFYHMARNIISSLIEVGYGKKKEEWIVDLLICRNKKFIPATISANGLYLISVGYPSHFSLPKSSKTFFIC